MTAPELVENAAVPDRFRQIMILYLETYEARVSDVYRTLRHKVIALAHFWRFIRDHYPEVKRCSQILPRNAQPALYEQIPSFAENVECGPDDRIYYLLHIKPSKFDRVPVIPIGDGLGRVLAADLGQISKHWSRFRRSFGLPLAVYIYGLRGVGAIFGCPSL